MSFLLISFWSVASALLFISMGSSPLGMAFAFTISAMSAFAVVAKKYDAGDFEKSRH
jgi:hypothetical protein